MNRILQNPPFPISIERHYDVLYKYTKSEYVCSMIREGKFRIGTLYEYQESEQAEIGDDGEGMKGYSLDDPETPYTEQIDRLRSIRPNLKISGELASRAASADCPVAFVEMSPDCYMYCLTSKFDARVMKRFGYDACIEIRRPSEFLIRLSEAMEDRASFGGLRVCQYENRWSLYDAHNNHAPQVLKDPRFAHQAEVRLLWDPRPGDDLRQLFPKRPVVSGGYGVDPDKVTIERPLEPVFVYSKKAARYCKRIV